MESGFPYLPKVAAPIATDGRDWRYSGVNRHIWIDNSCLSTETVETGTDLIKSVPMGKTKTRKRVSTEMYCTSWHTNKPEWSTLGGKTVDQID